MKIVGKRRPIDHVNPALSPERVARMWSVVEGAQRKSRARPIAIWTLAASFALVLGLAAALELREPTEPPRASAGDVLVSGPKQTQVRLPDGSQVTLGETSQLTVLTASAAEVRLQLVRGGASYEVAHRPERRFRVDAGELVLSESPQQTGASGTRFFVQIAASEHRTSQTTVRVERGAIEISDRNQQLLARLSAGQSWTSSEQAKQAVQVEASEHGSGSAEPQPLLEPRAQPAARRAEPEVLFNRANAARLSGQPLEAARAYEKLQAQHPRDVRAGLSAFELSRIRLDSLHDPRGALNALDFALSHNRGGFASEDAAALRIDALAQLSDVARCRAAADAFLVRYPSSAHQKRVARACPSE